MTILVHTYSNPPLQHKIHVAWSLRSQWAWYDACAHGMHNTREWVGHVGVPHFWHCNRLLDNLSFSLLWEFVGSTALQPSQRFLWSPLDGKLAISAGACGRAGVGNSSPITIDIFVKTVFDKPFLGLDSIQGRTSWRTNSHAKSAEFVRHGFFLLFKAWIVCAFTRDESNAYAKAEWIHFFDLVLVEYDPILWSITSVPDNRDR